MTNDHQNLAAFDDVERLLVVAAHPDDLECLCGGTVAMLARRGVTVFSANCTLGDIGAQDGSTARPALAATRIAEAEAAAQILGIEQTFNLGHHDGELLPDLELRAQIARLYRLTQADTLMTFDPTSRSQIHPDHRAAGQAALDAYMPAKMPLYRPEQLAEAGAAVSRLVRVFLFSTDREPAICVNVDEIYPTKLAAVQAHRSQFPKGEENLEWLKKLDRAAGEKIGATYGEQFAALGVY